jgi:hypothetical protein
MLPQAHIVHQLRGRVRLRIKEKRQDPAYFDTLCSHIEALEGVSEVSANPNTGSLLILHPDLPFAQIEDQLTALRQFELISAPEPQQTALMPVFKGVGWLDEGLAEGTSGSFDLPTLGVIGLLGVAAYQLYRGNIIGPAIPMLMAALDLARQIPTPSDKGQGQPPEA